MQNKTILFPGKFQPPHTGHFLTIHGLLEKYQRVIIAVTESNLLLNQQQIKNIFEKIFTDDRISVIIVSGSIEDGSAKIDIEFDVCASGNPKVLEIMATKGFEVEFLERSRDDIWEGTRIRNSIVSNFGAISASDEILSFEIVSLSDLKPIERIQKQHFLALEKAIERDGYIEQPIIVDSRTGAVLDGSHRYAFLLKHNYAKAPVYLCDYDDESIFVGNHLAHRFLHDKEKVLDKSVVRRVALSGSLFPARTTRHFFPFRKEKNPILLSALEQKFPQNDISNLYEIIDSATEKANNKSYIEELKREAKIIQSYLDEQKEVQAWLESQNDAISKNN